MTSASHPRPILRVADSARPERDRSGDVELGSFRLLGLLGRGSFASAYLADQLGTDRQAVVKIAHADLLRDGQTEAVKARFQDEVRASTRCQHPNLVTLYTAGQTADGLPAIAMEFVPGDPLEALLVRSAPLRTSYLSYFAQLTSVLATIHRMGIVHRDVSPGNVIVTRDHDGSPRAKLLDFGIATIPGAAAGTGAMGTPRYAAPEQIRGEAQAASDMFALGACLWWALTGRQYLDELDSIDRIVAHQMEQSRAPDPRTINRDILPALAEVTSRLLSPQPADRPTSADLLAQWPRLIAEARRHSRRIGRTKVSVFGLDPRRRPLQVVIVDPSSIKRHLIGSYAERLGCEVTVADDPRSLTRGEIGPFDVAILPTELPKVDAAGVSRHLREHFPGMRVVLMSSHGERVLDHADAGADIHLTVPGELSRLGEYLDSLRRSAGQDGGTPINTLELHEAVSSTVLSSWLARPRPELQGAVREFVGAMPTLLVQLDGIDPNADLTDKYATCASIEEHASSIGALHLARLAKSLRLLLEAGELPDPAGFIAEIEAEYQRAFRSLVPYLRT